MFFENASNTLAKLSGHRRDRLLGGDGFGVALIDRVIKVIELVVFTDRYPCGLDEFASQASVPAAGHRPSVDIVAGGTFARNQA